MGALTQKRMTRSEAFRTISLPLAAQVVYQGGMACYDTGALGAVKKGAVSSTLVRIGEFAESADNSGGAAPRVLVKLEREVFGTWHDNGTGSDQCTAGDVFGTAYILSDHEVSRASASKSAAGRIWEIDAVKGVLVEAVDPPV